MITVQEKPAPESFENAVRQKGLTFLRRIGAVMDQPLPAGIQLEPYWRACLDDLHDAYDGMCAYLCVYIERVTGGVSVDHFVAKSRKASLAYEWSNYRLACMTMNSRKRDYEDALDPFTVLDGWFHLELVTGTIYPNPESPPDIRERVVDTIQRLALDDTPCREMRSRHYLEYREGFYSADFLKKRSPFVWQEAQRQGLL
ncbi:MAG: hypothetical protein NTY19_12955 [Planctomycetota bacterium]|nr:hypothetical protein [Planctomycetota bacterium]